MPRYLVAIHHPDDVDPAAEDDAMRRDIDALNDQMVAAGVRVFVGVLHPATHAKSLQVRPGLLPGPRAGADMGFSAESMG